MKDATKVIEAARIATSANAWMEKRTRDELRAALAEYDAAEPQPLTDAQIVEALREVSGMLVEMKRYENDIITMQFHDDGSGHVENMNYALFGWGSGCWSEAIAKLRECSTPKPKRTYADLWQAFKEGTISANDRNLFCAWMGTQEPLARAIFRFLLDVQSGGWEQKELHRILDPWFAENGNVPVEFQDKEN